MMEEIPSSHSVINEYDVEIHHLSHSELPSLKRQTNDCSNYDQSSSVETFRQNEHGKDIAIFFVVFFDRIINRKQLVIAIISCMCGFYAVCISLIHDSAIYGYEARHRNAHAMQTVLLLYGLIQLILNVIFFSIYATTPIGHRKWRCQIIRFISCIIYLIVALLATITGLTGFYWVIKLYGHVEHEDWQSSDYVDSVLYKSSLFIFSLHLCFVFLNCCWWD